MLYSTTNNWKDWWQKRKYHKFGLEKIYYKLKSRWIDMKFAILDALNL